MQFPSWTSSSSMTVSANDILQNEREFEAIMCSMQSESWEPRAMPQSPEAKKEVQEWLERGSALDLSGLRVIGADFSGGDLTSSRFNEAEMSNVRLVNTRLSRSYFTSTDLRGADLTGASLYKAKIYGTDLRSASLDQANLSCVEVGDTDCRNASFRDADFTDAIIVDTDLRGADLTNANLFNTSFDVRIDETTIVSGLHGSAFGPASIISGETIIEMDNHELQDWLNKRGANIKILHSGEPEPLSDGLN